jgi:stalled ribosome rescue protein Dom34
VCIRGQGYVQLRSGRRRARGYSVAMLVGLEENVAMLWRVFSNVVKPEKAVRLGGVRSDVRALYGFHESVVDALRPALKEGVRSVVLVSPARSNYGKAFVGHVRLHHAWLAQGMTKISFSELAGSAGTLAEVAALVKSSVFRQVISETVVEESEGLVELLERRLNASGGEVLVFYSLGEVEGLVFGSWVVGKPRPEFLLLTDAFLAGCRAKSRLQRLMQVAVNKGVKVRVVTAESAVGVRIGQFGGLILLLKID